MPDISIGRGGVMDKPITWLKSKDGRLFFGGSLVGIFEIYLPIEGDGIWSLLPPRGIPEKFDIFPTFEAAVAEAERITSLHLRSRQGGPPNAAP